MLSDFVSRVLWLIRSVGAAFFCLRSAKSKFDWWCTQRKIVPNKSFPRRHQSFLLPSQRRLCHQYHVALLSPSIRGFGAKAIGSAAMFKQTLWSRDVGVMQGGVCMYLFETQLSQADKCGFPKFCSHDCACACCGLLWSVAIFRTFLMLPSQVHVAHERPTKSW